MEQALSPVIISKLNELADEIELIAKDANNEFDEIAREILDIREELANSKPNIQLLKKSFKALMWGSAISCRTAIEEIVKKALSYLSFE